MSKLVCNSSYISAADDWSYEVTKWMRDLVISPEQVIDRAQADKMICGVFIHPTLSTVDADGPVLVSVNTWFVLRYSSHTNSWYPVVIL